MIWWVRLIGYAVGELMADAAIGLLAALSWYWVIGTPILATWIIFMGLVVLADATWRRVRSAREFADRG